MRISSELKGCQVQPHRSGFARVAAAALLSLAATCAHAQTSQFLFDKNGNLTVQIADSVFPPQITGQPQNQVVATNESAAFSVVVTDPRAIAYQWRFNGANITGENGVSLLLDNVTTNDEGEYRVVLTNPSGSVTSAPAFLMIDNDGDGLGDSWEMTYFGNLDQNATTDFDGDGVSNIREFLDGTDPTDPNSVRYRLLVIREGGTVLKNPDQVSYNKGESVTLTVTASSNELFHAWLGDIVTRDNPITLVMTNDKTVYARFTPIVFTWTNPASGDWDTATNWTPNLAPGLNDIANINSGVTVTLNTPADCAEVTLGGSPFATLTGSGTLTVRGNLFWTAGTMSGTGRTILETTATFSLPTGVSLDARTLENGGTILWGAGGVLGLTGGAVITNRTGSLFRVESLAATSLGNTVASGRIDNAGVFLKAANTGPLTIASGLRFNNSGTVELAADTVQCNGSFNNSGTVSLEAGTLFCSSSSRFTNNGAVILSAGTTSRLAGGGSGSGTFTAPATATVEWTANNYVLNPGAQLSGSGLYRTTAGSFTANTSLTVENLDVLGGGFDGTGTLTINNAMNWTGGGMGGTGRTIISPGVTANVGSVSLTSRTLENGGTVLWTGAGGIGMSSGAVITNRPGALFHAQIAAALSSSFSGNRFDNAGTFRKSVNSGTTTISSSFNNSGTVEIQTGTLLCNGGTFTNNGAVILSAGTTNRLAGGGSGSGTFTTPATAMVEWTANNYVMNLGAQLSGSGLYRLNFGSITVNTSLTVENLDVLAGGFDGSGTMTIAGAMNWSGGGMGGTGRTIISPGVTANVGSVSLTSRTLENGGTVLWTGAGGIGMSSGAVITNRPGALFHAQIAAALSSSFSGNRFDNAGTFRKSVSTGTTVVGVNFTNYGTVEIRSGILAANGGYTSTSNSVLNCALGGTTAGTGYGQLQAATAVLNGALSVDLINGFLPALNDSFTVVSGTRNGTFANFLYPSNAVTMQLSNGASSVIARVTGVVAPQPLLSSPTLTGSNVLLSWTAISNTTYRLEFSPDLAPSNWNALPGDVTATSNGASKLDPLTPSNRFYRVRVLP